MPKVKMMEINYVQAENALINIYEGGWVITSLFATSLSSSLFGSTQKEDADK